MLAGGDGAPFKASKSTDEGHSKSVSDWGGAAKSVIYIAVADLKNLI